MVDGKVVRESTGRNAHELRLVRFDLRELRGRRGTIEIIDEQTGGWGNTAVDEIVLSDEPRRDRPARRAIEAVARERGVDQKVLRAWVHTLQDVQADDPGDPFSAWVRAAAASAGDPDHMLGSPEKSDSEPAASGRVLEDFLSESLGPWQETGWAFDRGVVRAGGVVGRELRLSDEACVDSGAVSERLLGTLRSPTRTYAMQCLIARRLVERGVRFIELTCPAISGNDRWDQHANLRTSHESNARAVDQPIAALLTDLKRRGMLEDTLVIWGAEFGRTPFAQGTNGRDHNPFGFSMWLAGGGVRSGMTLGSTDDYGYKAVDRPLEIHDLHATMLHLLGVDHTRLTVPFGGREMRLTDVHGHVIRDILV